MKRRDLRSQVLLEKACEDFQKLGHVVVLDGQKYAMMQPNPNWNLNNSHSVLSYLLLPITCTELDKPVNQVYRP